MDATHTPLLNGIAPPPNTFVLPQHKVVYVSVTKAACTSMRWMVADLAGEDLDSFIGTVGAQQSRLLGIHGQRKNFVKTPQLTTLEPGRLAEIDPAGDWFVFAVIRSPYSRLWSAWQSKFLVRHARYVETYADRPWFPRVPESQEQVLADWHTFVHSRAWESDPELKRDVHFKCQVRSARPEGVNYTRVYDVTDLPRLFEDLHAHLKPLGLDQPLYSPRANETPLPMIPAALEEGSREIIEDSYAEDFAAWGERWSVAKVKMADGWSDDAIAHAAYHTVANERIGDLRTVARQKHHQLRRAQRRIAKLKEANAAAAAPATRSLTPRSGVARLLDSGPAHRVAQSPTVRRVLPERVLRAARRTVRGGRQG